LNKEGITLSQAAMMAGLAYLVMTVIAPFCYGFVYTELVKLDDIPATVSNLTEHETLFRCALVGFILIMLADIAVSLGLYVYLSPVNRAMALLSAWLRLIYVAIFSASLTSLFDMLNLVKASLGAGSVATSHLATNITQLAHHFDFGWLLGLVFFAFHLLLIGALIIQSNYMPKMLAILVAVAGLGYLIDSLAHFLMADYDHYKEFFAIVVTVPAAIGELALCLWLLIKGRKVVLD